MELKVDNATSVVKACIVLNNFLLKRKDTNYCPPAFVDQDRNVRSSTAQAREVRDELKDYFFAEGAVSFQWAMTE